jgi:predicted acylesterase/phospholipase RssA
MRYLILGPGALGFYTMLGYLMKNESQLRDIEEISGASSGAIIGFFMLSNKSLQEIFDLTITIDLSDLTKVELKTFINSFGFINHELIKQKLIEIWGGNPTFKELPKKLYVSAYCLNTLEVEYFSRDTHPDMHVVDALCASISIPVIFAAYESKDKRYTDGATNEGIPAVPFLHKHYSDVLCVEVLTNLSSDLKLDTLLDYFKAIALTGWKNKINYDVPIVRLDTGTINVLDFKASFETRLKLFMIGYGS